MTRPKRNAKTDRNKESQLRQKERRMKLKNNSIYENIEELKKAIQEKSIKVEDELITEDIDGEAIYVVANITDKEIALVRKFVLRDPKPRRYKYDLIDWLNHEYKDTLDETLKAMMIAPEGQQLIDLPREVEVFGENEYGVPEEGSRWEYFTKLNNRICGTSENAEWSEWWWMNTQARASAAYFCRCHSYGNAGYDSASNAHIYVRPRFILAIA